jgi:hypothetical protein
MMQWRALRGGGSEVTTGSGAGSSAPDRPDRSGVDSSGLPDVEFAGSEYPDAESVGLHGADYDSADYDGADHDGPPLPGGPEFADADTTRATSSAPPAADGAGRPAGLRLEPATAFGVEGYDPADPWNAVLCVENDTVATVLPLTPRSLDHLLAGLVAVRDAQRAALGGEPPVLDEEAGAGPDEHRGERPGALRQFGNAARLATGSASVARMWNDAGGGRWVIIGGAVLFVLIGFLASLFTR